MNRSLPTLAALAVLLLAVLLLAPTAPLAGSPVRLGIIPVADVLPLYVALDQGAFAAEGIELELVNLASGTRIIEGLAGGSLDIGFSATLSILQAAEQGLPLTVVEPAAFVRTDRTAVNGLMVLASSAIKSPTELRGKTIGVNALNSINYLMTVELLSRAGIGAKQVTWQEIPFPQMPPALEYRSVDAVSIVEPFLTVLRDSGKAVVLSPGQDVVPGISMSAYAALRPWYESHRPLVEAFGRAYRKGVEWCNREPARARQVLVKYTKTSGDLAERIGLHLYRSSIEPADLVLLGEMGKRHGLLREPINVDRLLAPNVRRH